MDTKNSPLNEAAFLGHNSHVYAKYGYEYLDTQTVDVSKFFDFPIAAVGTAEYDSHSIAAGMEYSMNNSILRVNWVWFKTKLKQP